MRRKFTTGSPVVSTWRITASACRPLIPGRTSVTLRPTWSGAGTPFIVARAGLTCRNRRSVSKTASPTGERANSQSSSAPAPRVRRACVASTASPSMPHRPPASPATGDSHASSSTVEPSLCCTGNIPVTLCPEVIALCSVRRVDRSRRARNRHPAAPGPPRRCIRAAPARPWPTARSGRCCRSPRATGRRSHQAPSGSPMPALFAAAT